MPTACAMVGTTSSGSRRGARAGQDDQACVSAGEEVGQLGELRVAAYQRADRRGKRAVSRGERVGVIESRVLPEDLLL